MILWLMRQSHLQIRIEHDFGLTLIWVIKLPLKPLFVYIYTYFSKYYFEQKDICSSFISRPESRQGYPPNLSILISGGKENNRDTLYLNQPSSSNLERILYIFGFESLFRNWSDIFLALHHVKVTNDEHGDKSFKLWHSKYSRLYKILETTW